MRELIHQPILRAKIWDCNDAVDIDGPGNIFYGRCLAMISKFVMVVGRSGVQFGLLSRVITKSDERAVGMNAFSALLIL